MRVSTRMMENSYLEQISQHQERLYRLQQQIASGKRLLDPWDDPAAAREATGVRTGLDANRQYQTNLEDARAVVENAHSVTGEVVGLVDKAQQIAVRGASDSITPDGRRALGEEVNQVLEELLGQANDSTLGRHTFAGVNTNTPPYVATRDAQGRITSVAAAASAVSGAINRQVGTATTLKVNLNGSDVFGGAGAPAGSTDAFALLIQLRDALNAANGDTVRLLIPQVGALHDQVQGQVTVADARAQRLTRVQGSLERQQLDGESGLSRLEDVDVARAALELQTEQAVYQQALQVGNKILSLTLGAFQP